MKNDILERIGKLRMYASSLLEKIGAEKYRIMEKQNELARIGNELRRYGQLTPILAIGGAILGEKNYITDLLNRADKLRLEIEKETREVNKLIEEYNRVTDEITELTARYAYEKVTEEARERLRRATGYPLSPEERRRMIEIEELLRQLEEAYALNDYARVTRIRRRLRELGYII